MLDIIYDLYYDFQILFKRMFKRIYRNLFLKYREYKCVYNARKRNKQYGKF